MDTSKTYIKMSDHPKIQKHEPGEEYEIVSYLDKNIHIDNYGNYWAYKKDSIWLPLQWQIQEMLGVVAKRFVHILVNRFHIFCLKTPRKGQLLTECLNSFEQLWLAFYMYEKHKLAWDGKEWKKEK